MDWKIVSIFFVSRTLISMLVTCAPEFKYEVEKANKMVKEPRKTISAPSEVCGMSFIRLETVCRDAMKAVSKEYQAQGFEIKATEDVSAATTYKLTISLCKSLYVKACECPTIPTLYLRDKKSKSGTNTTIIVTIVKPKRNGLLGWFSRSDSKSSQLGTRSSSIEKPISQPKWDEYDESPQDTSGNQNDKKSRSNKSNVNRQASGNLSNSSQRDDLAQNSEISSHNDSKRLGMHPSHPPDDKTLYENGNNSHDSQGDGNIIQTSTSSNLPTQTPTNEDNTGSIAHQQTTVASTPIPENKPKFDSLGSSQESSEKIDLGNFDPFGLELEKESDRIKNFDGGTSHLKEGKQTLVFDGIERKSSNENVLIFDDLKSDQESHHENLLKFDDLRSDQGSHHGSFLKFDDLGSDRESHHENLLKFDDLRSDQESHHVNLLNFDDLRSDAGDNKDDFFSHQTKYDQTDFHAINIPAYDEDPFRQFDAGKYVSHQTKNDYNFDDDEVVVNRYRRFKSNDGGQGSVKWDKK